MSSHHIVRENQEPALLVAEFNALPEDYFGQLLEWSPTIITNFENLDYFLSQGIKIDVLYEQGIEAIFQEEIKIISREKDFLEDTLSYLIENKYKAVNILLGELDSTIIEFADRINIVVFTNGVRYAVVRTYFEKWKAKGEIMFLDISILKSFTGLRHLKENVFEVFEDGFVVVEMNTDDFVFVGESI
ncbi:thiamine pyrophosphokinase [Sphingobacterium composti Ten et al. 2007 non Yoo et al. 2007]|uniref:thiamine pyrophosphokinase n=1 Tax=Sphingobacterium composti TaxID=363260 RepID=UPI00135B9386|nr:thiamine pyrophosphokinase [Sphingobacterium composti Ten et al. 2007 non Yoo et al. 2007]